MGLGLQTRKMDNMKETKTYPRALSIAGSDCSGGAGIQADLKAFSAMGAYGMTAITAVVDENTAGVYGVHPIPTDFVCGQIRSCLDDIGADAVKIGMLHSTALIEAVTETLIPYGVPNIVLDPVMVATSGDPLLQADAVDSLKGILMPWVTLITPNIPEAEILLGGKIDSGNLFDAARQLASGGNAVLLKGGHLDDETITDVLCDPKGKQIVAFKHSKVDTRNTHGTGCTLSSAIAAGLANGKSLKDATDAAVKYVAGAIMSGAKYSIGHGHGPVHHFFHFWK